LEEIKERIKTLLQELVKEIYTYPIWQFKRLDYYDATGGEIELIDYLLEKFEKVNPATVLWYISHFPQNVDKGKALADALMVEKFEYIDNPEGFLRSKIAFNQKKELKFLLDARVQKLIRNLLEDIKEEFLQNPHIEEKENHLLKEPSYLKYEPVPEQLFISILTTDAIELLWRALNQEQKRDFFNNFLKRHPLLEKFIKDKYSSVEELEEDIKNLTQRFEETLELPWPKEQVARFLNLLEAYAQENNVNY
jgi:hypothetical protein